MKIILCNKFDSSELLELKEVPMPFPKDNEVLLYNCATSVTASGNLMRGLKDLFIIKFNSVDDAIWQTEKSDSENGIF